MRNKTCPRPEAPTSHAESLTLHLALRNYSTSMLNLSKVNQIKATLEETAYLVITCTARKHPLLEHSSVRSLGLGTHLCARSADAFPQTILRSNSGVT